jgi:hypothetical protein
MSLVVQRWYFLYRTLMMIQHPHASVRLAFQEISLLFDCGRRVSSL